MTSLRTLLHTSLVAGALLVTGTALAAEGAARHQHHGATAPAGIPCAMDHQPGAAKPCGCGQRAPDRAWEKSSDAVSPDDVGYQAG